MIKAPITNSGSDSSLEGPLRHELRRACPFAMRLHQAEKQSRKSFRQSESAQRLPCLGVRCWSKFFHGGH
jgi:hypothetical protein